MVVSGGRWLWRIISGIGLVGWSAFHLQIRRMRAWKYQLQRVE
jgi:hypothetical protein